MFFSRLMKLRHWSDSAFHVLTISTSWGFSVHFLLYVASVIVTLNPGLNLLTNSVDICRYPRHMPTCLLLSYFPCNSHSFFDYFLPRPPVFLLIIFPCCPVYIRLSLAPSIELSANIQIYFLHPLTFSTMSSYPLFNPVAFKVWYQYH